MINQNLNLFLIFMVGIKIKTKNSMKGELNLHDCPVVSEACEALFDCFHHLVVLEVSPPGGH